MTAAADTELLVRFYDAFDRRDGSTMAACYARDARFTDPVFVDLRGAEIGAMWELLTSSSQDLRVELVEHRADDGSGTARWIARYTFPQTGRPIVNEVRSAFRFSDGLIAEQRDDFDFHRWSRQALGLPGLLLGWTPLLRRSVRARARGALDRWTAARG